MKSRLPLLPNLFLCWLYILNIGAIGAAQSDFNIPSSVPTSSLEPTPVYYYNPPTSFVFKPKHTEEAAATYFGPAIGVGLVFTCIFVYYWRKHMLGNDHDALFLDDDDEEYLDEVAALEESREPQTRGEVMESEGGGISMNRLIHDPHHSQQAGGDHKNLCGGDDCAADDEYDADDDVGSGRDDSGNLVRPAAHPSTQTY